MPKTKKACTVCCGRMVLDLVGLIYFHIVIMKVYKPTQYELVMKVWHDDKLGIEFLAIKEFELNFENQNNVIYVP